ncbi:ABC transporter permease [Alloacidobacterium sp.]|uniref:ABC transporter permease n=1 Tax=Alloacidobacterium sp. TaxID=2951999 RepID=UPI002D6FEE08|nr:ABC transporter permease [Alloacidobacterium sp.]HYK38325.1 ABC transporter permease [Alloacidobacterium sp.]
MRFFAWLRSVAAKFFRHSQTANDMDEELRLHIQLRADDLEREGLGRVEAERRARIEFGGYERYKEESHEALGGNFVETLVQDVRFSLRLLHKSPGFAITAVLTLALAIGANAVVFGVLDALVLRPLNVPDAQNLYAIQPTIQHNDWSSHSYPDYLDLRDRNRSFDGIVAYEMAPAGLYAGDRASPIWLYETSGNYFDELKIQPYLGRFFHSADEHGPNSAPYIVLSYDYWRSHFLGDPSVVGRALELNKFPYTVLGVAPPQFRGTELFFAPDLWAPLVNKEQIEGYSGLTSRGERGLWLAGHLTPGVTPAEAAADLNLVASYLAKTYPKDDDGIRFSLARPGLIGNMLGGPVRAFAGGLMALAGLIMLAACANLGSLFAARTADRSREVALRLALGSTRKRILRQLLTEAALVSLIGGVLGMLAAVLLLHWLSAWQPVPDMPINVPVNPNASTYIAALVMAVASGFLFGIVPARQIMKADPYLVIKSGPVGAAGTRRFTLRDVLLTGQIAVCAMLVTASLVAVRGMVRSLHSNFGFDPQNTMQVNTDLDMARYSGDQVQAMQRRIQDAVAAIPGVTAAGYADGIPLNLGWRDSTVFADSTTDYRPSNGAADSMEYRISPGYFKAAATTLIAGRAFTWHDDKNAPRVAVVNEEFARKVFGSVDKAIGGYFKIWGGTRVQVVGVAEDGKYKTLAEDPQPAMFVSILQFPSSSTWLLVRSRRDPQQLATELERVLRGLDAGLPFTINTWHKKLDTALFVPRAATMALGILGVMGAMLAVTGIFGMAAYSVSKRMREMGIRIALGAQRREVLQAALGRAVRLLAFGSAAGLLLGLLASRVLAFIVYQATPRDPLVLAGVVLAMSLLGLLATWIPAQRALSVDPLILLRDE